MVMHSAFALAPLTLAAVLVFSGLAKRPDPASTHSMMTLLRLPGFVATRPMAHVVPWVEIGIAALLLTPWRWTFAVGAVAALGLFLAFWVIIARAMTFDPRPSCGCFGRVGDHRVNGKTVARNTLLVALALSTAWIAWEGRSGTGLLADFRAGDWLWLLLAVALAAVAVLILGGGPSHGPTRTQRREARRREKEAQRAGTGGRAGAAGQGGAGHAHDHGGQDAELDYVRSPIPRGVLIGKDLETTSLHQLAREQAQLLVLANCWCGSTAAAVDRLPAWREQLPALGVQLIHTLKPWDEARLARLDGVWWDPGSHLYDALRSGPSPAAVLLGADGLLAGGPVNGVEEIEEFVADIAAELAEAGQAEAADLPADA